MNNRRPSHISEVTECHIVPPHLTSSSCPQPVPHRSPSQWFPKERNSIPNWSKGKGLKLQDLWVYLEWLQWSFKWKCEDGKSILVIEKEVTFFAFPTSQSLKASPVRQEGLLNCAFTAQPQDVCWNLWRVLLKNEPMPGPTPDQLSQNFWECGSGNILF